MIFPQEIKGRRQFVVWGVHGKPVKQPFAYVNGKFVDKNWNYSETLITFDEATALVERGKAQGIGIVFNGGGIYGVDLDNVYVMAGMGGN